MFRQKILKALRSLNVLSSIRGKITFILLALAVTAGGAGYLTYQSFDRVSQNVGEMTATDLPKLEQSNGLILAAAKAKDAMIGVLVSETEAELTEASAYVSEATAALVAAINALPAEQRSEFEEEQAHATETLDALISARSTSFSNASRLESMTLDLQRSAADLQSVLLEIADDAYFNIAIKGEDTISSIEDTLLDLTEVKFSTLQALLGTRAEINFLSGVSLAMATTTDSAMLSIFGDLATSAHDRLTDAVLGLEGTEVGDSIGAELQAISETLKKAADSKQSGRAG